IPLGSANDYSFSLGQDKEPGNPADAYTRQVDVGWVQAETGKDRFFVNTLGLGFSGLVSVESRRIHWLQGLSLYGLALLRPLCFRYECPTMTVTLHLQARTALTLS